MIGERRHHNGMKTFALFLAMWALIMGVGYLVTRGSAAIFLFAAFGVVMTAISWWNSASLAIRSMRARPVSQAEAPAMHRIVRELSQAAGQPMPALYVSPADSPHAFATGRSPAHAAVCSTEGILRLLNERELRGVLGHELMHVYNRDILTSAVAAAMAGIITSVAQFLMFAGGGGGRGRRDGNMLAVLAMAILAPMAAALIRLAISRNREYDADEDGARLTGDPLALASALAKLDGGIAQTPLAPTPATEDVSHMMIANPFRGGASRLFATHPPIRDRIARLTAMV
jgi:heat shock protein HtpX